MRGVWSGGQMIQQSMDIKRDFEQERAIDTVLNLSLPGDAIVLVRGAGAPDDDKRRSSSTLWRLSPFEPMPALFTQVRPDLVGQPRLYRGRRIYTFSHPRPSIGEIPGQSMVPRSQMWSLGPKISKLRPEKTSRMQWSEQSQLGVDRPKRPCPPGQARMAQNATDGLQSSPLVHPGRPRSLASQTS